MIVLMASGNAAIDNWDLTESLRSLSATIATELAEVVHGSAHYHVLFFIGVFLFIVTFVINFIGSWFINRFKSKLSGAGS
jgi:phosphate transport system permease protein